MAWIVRFKNLIGFVVIITILFSYVPVFSMDQCPERNHIGNVKMDCGYSFHCPMVINKNILGIYSLPLNGLLVPAKPLLVVDELIRVIFHPPKDLRFSCLQGWRKRNNLALIWHKNCCKKLDNWFCWKKYYILLIVILFQHGI